MKTDLFPSCGHCRVFQICRHIECCTFTASSFRVWNGSTGIPSPPLALLVVMLPKAHLSSHSRISGSKWVITPSWLSGSWRSFLFSSSVYSCHLFLISSASVRSIPFLSFIEPIFVIGPSLIFLKRYLVFPILLFSSISLHWSLRKAFLSLLAILWNSAFKWVYLSFSPMPFTSHLFTVICKQMWELDYKEGWTPKNWLFRTVVLEKTLESPWDSKEIKPVNPKEYQSWIFIGRTDAEAEAPVLWPSDAKSQLIGRDPDAGKDWRREENGMTEDEMVGWYHWHNGHKLEQTQGNGEGQGSLSGCSSRGSQRVERCLPTKQQQIY